MSIFTLHEVKSRSEFCNRARRSSPFNEVTTQTLVKINLSLSALVSYGSTIRPSATIDTAIIIL